MKKTVNLLTLSVFIVSNIFTPLTNFIYAEENVTLEDGGDLSMVRDMENVGNDDEVISQTTPKESGETSTESVETPNPENSQSEENNIPDEQPSEESQGDEQKDKSTSGAPELYDTAPIIENSSLDLLKDTIDNISINPDNNTTTELTQIEEDREITLNEDTTVTHYPDSNISYTLNSGFSTQQNFTAGTITLTDGSTTITILDRNLGATEAGTGCEDPSYGTVCAGGDNTYGYHFQWGNNYGFDPNDSSVGENAQPTQVQASSITYNPSQQQYYSSNTFIIGNENWLNDNNIVDLWGGSVGDGEDFEALTAEQAKLRRGPCPENFHVPSRGELNKMKSMMGNDASKIHNDLKIPFAGYRDNDDASVDLLGGTARLWSSSPSSASNPDSRYLLLRVDGSLDMFNNYRAFAYSVRCFYDEYDVYTAPAPQPIKITYDPNGGAFSGKAVSETIVVTYTPGETYTPDINIQFPNKESEDMAAQSGWMFDGWYTTSVFADQTSATEWTGFVDENTESQTVYAKWLPFNDLPAITGNDGTEYILMDRNLGATDVWNYGDAQNTAAKNGKYYQWGNNYGFSSDSSISPWPYTSEMPVDVSGYGPGNYYSSTIFIFRSSSPYAWDTTDNDNLWGGAGDSENADGDGTTEEGRQGPCPLGYHVPSIREWQVIYDALGISSDATRTFQTILHLPMAGYRGRQDSKVGGQSSYGSYWSSSRCSENYAYGPYFLSPHIQSQGSNTPSNGFSVRCLKNTPIVTYISDGVVVATQKSTETAPTPSKDGYTFAGWYDNPEFNGSAVNFSSITEDIILYAKWIQCGAGQTYYPEIGACATKSADNIVYYRIDENNNNVISIKDPNGNTVLTMLDKNEGATIAWNNGDSLTQANMGSHFQRGNNYGFSQTPEPTKSQDRAEYKNYRPGHSYNNSTFIGGSSNLDYRQNDIHYNNLWGGGNDKGVTTSIDTFRGGIKNGKTRQGPCNTGYHVPSMGEWNAAITYRWNTKNPDSTQKSTTNFCYFGNSDSAGQPDIFASDFKLPKAGYRGYYSSSYGSIGYNGYYLSSSPRPSDYSNSTYEAYRIWFTSDNVSTTDLTDRARASGFSVRCFKDSPEAPETRTVTFQANGGNLLGATNGNLIQLVEDGKKAQQPVNPTISETGKIFSHWEKVSNHSEFNLSNTNITEDITLKAIYDCDTQHGYHKENDVCVANIYTITFKDGNTVLSLQPTSATYGTHITLPTAPAKNGYEFKGWYKESTFNNLWNQSTDIVTNNTTIYAKYDPIYVVTFDSDGGSSIAPYSVAQRSYLLYTGSETKYSHTQNVDDTGRKTDNYNNNWSNSNIRGTDRTYASSQAHVLTFTGATKLIVNLYYNGESTQYDWVSVWKGNYPSYTADNRTSVGYVTTSDGAPDNNNKFGGSWSNTYTVNGNTLTSMGHSTLNIPGDSVTFAFRSDVSQWGQGYGYYAVIQPILKIPATQPTKDGWVFDGWYKPNGEKWNYDQDTVTQDITLKAHWREPRAVLSPGQSFNVTLKSLVNSSIQSYSTTDSTIRNFVRSNTNWGSNKKLISDSDLSDIDIWARYDSTNNTVYYYAASDKIYMNPDSVGMFYNMQGLTSLDLSNLDTSKVTNMAVMFNGCTNLKTLILDGWDLSQSTNGSSIMSTMFSGTSSLEKVSMRSWKIPTTFTHAIGCRTSGLCAETLQELDVTNWDLSETTNIQGLFGNSKTKQIIGLDTWDTSNIIDMNQMFQSCTNLTSLDLSNFDTSNVTNMSVMFNGCSNLKSLKLDNWNLSKLSNPDSYNSMFGGATSLEKVSMRRWKIPTNFTYALGCRASSLCTETLQELDVTDWNLSETTNIQRLFTDSKTQKIIGLDTWNTSNITDMSYMFQNCSNLTGLNLSSWNTSNVQSMSAIFYGNSSLTELNLSGWNTSKVTNMQSMFYGDNKLKTLDVSHFNTSNVTNMANMFEGCSKLKTLDVSHFNTSKVSDMSSMFRNCTSLTGLNLDNFNTSAATNMQSMFGGCNKLTKLDLSNFNTSQVSNMSYMFQNCSSLKDLNVSTFNTSNVTDVSGMFKNCSSLTGLDLSNLNTSQVYNMNSMFQNCASLKELNISSWDTNNVTNMASMFDGDSKLTTVYASNKFVTNRASNSTMFQDTYDIRGGKGTTYDISELGTKYAKIDEKGSPGYFTDILDTEYEIIYDTNGGTITGEKVTYTAKESFDLVTPSREGYSFVGWIGSNGNDPEIQVTIQTGTTGELYFIANWSINTYKIIFDTDGGNDIPFIEREYKSSLADISLPSPTKEGYTFLGWNRTLPATMPGEDITFVAQWESVNKPSSSGGGGGGGGGSSAIDVVKESVDSNTDTHKAAEGKDEVEEKTTLDGNTSEDKEGVSEDNVKESTDSSNIETSESTYSEEFTEAYSFAKSNGITTKSTIQEAKMNSTLTRIQMAKMLSYYAINVFGQDPDMTQTIKFEDVSDKRDAEYDNGVTLAYQLGIMGINMKNNKFRPDDEVTRAEFVTALSRMIYGMKDGTGKMKYYEPHMTRLYNEGIINNTNPKMKEKRGYVMIMLMRTVK